MPAPLSTLFRLVFPIVTAAAAAGCQEGPPTGPENGKPDAVPALATATGPKAFVQISQGFTHTCGVTADSRAYCWGSNPLGELGNGTQNPSLTPQPVAGDRRFQSVSAGNRFTCGLTTDGAAYCWGANFDGTLGDGSTADLSAIPVALAGNRRYRQLRAGGAHICAVTLGDVPFCWGNNQFRQLGAAASAPDRARVPLRVETGGRTFRRILPGGAHTCALTADGVAYCWGNNNSGQLGNGAAAPTMPLGRVLG